MTNIIRKLNELPKPRAAQLAFLLAAVLVIADYLINITPGFDIFYLVPLSILTWSMSGTAAAILACVCTGIWLGHNLLDQTHHNLSLYWQTISKLMMFLAYIFVLDKFKLSRVSQGVLTHKDELTGIANRFAFYEISTRELQRCRRHSQSVTLAYVNCDDFRVFNERFGFAVGDDLLKTIARTLQDIIRQTDLAARLTGDEFAILLPATDATKGIQVITKIHNRLIEAVNRRKWPVTFSIAITTFNKAPESVETINVAADKLLSAVRRAGGNRIHHEVF